MEGISCAICCSQYDDSTVVPKMLKCGHTVCSPCLDKLMKSSPVCPHCRESIPSAQEEFATNFALLELAQSISCRKLNEFSIASLLQAVQNKLTVKADKLNKDKTELVSDINKIKNVNSQIKGSAEKNAQGVDKANANLESVCQRVQKKVSPVVPPPKKSVSISIPLHSVVKPKACLKEIWCMVRNGKEMYSAAKVGNQVRYGKITTEGNQIRIHSVNNLDKPEGKTSIWIDDIKECILGSDKRHFFMRLIESKERGDGREFMLPFELLASPPDRFIALCTGELGASYKGSSFTYRLSQYGIVASMRRVLFFKDEEGTGEVERGSTTYTASRNEVIIRDFSPLGTFNILGCHRNYTTSDVIGRCWVWNEEDLKSEGTLKIVDCGLLFEF